MRQRWVWLVVIGNTTTAVCGALPEEQLALARHVIAGHVFGRQALRSGIWRAHGKGSHNSKQDGVDREGEIKLFNAFDIDQQLFRFDNEEPMFSRDGVRKEKLGGYFIRTREMTVQRGLNGHTISITPLDYNVGVGLGGFDIRCVGSTNRATLEGAPPVYFPFEKVFGSMGFMKESLLVEATRESGHLIRLTWLLGKGMAKATIWFDESQDFAPIRYECLVAKRRNGKIVKPSEWPKAAEHSASVSWRKLANVWVPTSLLNEDKEGLRDEPYEATSVRQMALTFDWESVNQPVPAKLFEPADLGADNPVPVLDMRLGGKPIIVSHPSIPDPEKLRHIQQAAEAAQRQEKPSDRRWLVFGVVAVICLVASGVYIGLRRRN